MTDENKIKYTAGLILVSAAVLLGGCAMGGADGTKTAQGVSSLEEGEYQRALTLFQDAVEEGEQEMLAYRGMGIAYLGLAQYEDAEDAFEAALECSDDRQPENVQDISLYLATAQYRNGNYEETVITCTDIMAAAETGCADAYYLRGASYLFEGQQEDAARDFEAAVALEPEDYDLYLNIYETYRSQNLSGAGSAYLQSALNIQGEDTEHYYNRGRIYYYLEDYEEAQRQLIGPAESGHEPSMYLIARVYLAMDDYGHAESVYQQLEQQSGEAAGIYNGLAMCAIEKGDYDDALGYIAKGLSAGEGAELQELYFNEIIVYEKKLDFETAKTKAKEYVERYPGDETGQKEWTFLSTR